jgi:hypothetical protein
MRDAVELDGRTPDAGGGGRRANQVRAQGGQWDRDPRAGVGSRQVAVHGDGVDGRRPRRSRLRLRLRLRSLGRLLCGHPSRRRLDRAVLAQHDDQFDATTPDHLNVERPVPLATVEDQLQDLCLREYVGVDRVVLVVEHPRTRADLLLGALRLVRVLVDVACPLVEVLDPRALRPLLVIEHHMLERSGLTVDVEREPLVRNGIEKHAPRRQLAQMVADRRDRIVAVLEEVIRDDEVDGAILDAAELFTVVDDRDFDEGEVVELGVVFAQARNIEPIDVADLDPRRDLDREVQRADFDSRP